MENKGLLFIPDISGFTRFINETEIEHSRLIIQELLEILVNENRIGLEISEIEGDAILFYRFGPAPGLQELYKQVQTMFCAFHRQLIAYEYRRFCQCKACTSAIGLSLKIITHYGEYTGYHVKNFRKLLGKDVIVAHQLLKNDIDQHEYWLVTDKVTPEEPPRLAEWMEWSSSAKNTETGNILFRYTQLGPMKNEVEPDPLPQLQLAKKKKMISVSRDYATDIIPLFHASGDFSYRNRWREDIKDVEQVTHLLPRVGMRCRCLLQNGETSIYASSYSFSPEQIEFSETEEATNNTTYYRLQKRGDQTKLTIEYYIPKSLVGEFLFNLKHKNKMQECLQRALQNMEKLLREIQLPAPAA